MASLYVEYSCPVGSGSSGVHSEIVPVGDTFHHVSTGAPTSEPETMRPSAPPARRT